MILLDETKLNLLLEQKKRLIGKTVVWDSVLSAISFLVSVYLASYDDVLGIPGGYLKFTFTLIGILFTLKSFYDVYSSLKNTYTSADLLEDINKLNEITHNHSIVVIKNAYTKYPNKFLLYHDVRWDCDLFLNFKENINNENFIISGLSNQLKIDPEDISLAYITKNIHEKFSVSHKENRMYCHRLYQAKIDNFHADMKKDEFEIDGTQYKWMSITEMEQDPRIMEVNSDIVDLVKKNCS